ncbi:hypothetical protein EV385_1568 [Krasilnikovia cinnamomea]|uniref:Uncharacterized protein n=1 Tax=Krasilnikovia cinnamomea TaxID=349313 RepID=A0A4Q7ZHW0_9ACTN|nr:hypothetical protein [Krasilnikovia cinnamomea]RZU49813.1 hypothetical protein EV385_1568 [Krasilnikovia cinnamomea]
MTAQGEQAAPQWGSFTGDQVAALTRGTSFLAEPRERDCPACGRRAVRAYLNAPPQARRPTLVSYVWCSACHRFVGTRAAHPAGIVVSDPLAVLSAEQRRELEGSLVGFLTHLDRLWDSGVLPQTFTAAV